MSSPQPTADTHQSNKNVWQTVFQRCKKQLSTQELAAMRTVTTYEDLNNAVVGFREKYRKKSISRALEGLEPLMGNLRSFNGVVDTMVQSNPQIASLVWGSIKFALELALRVNGAVERVAAGLKEIGESLPRLEEYKELFPNAPRVSASLAELYESIVSFCIFSIKFLKRHPLSNIVISLWSNFDAKLKQAISEVQAQVSRIDKESYAAKMSVDDARHSEIKALIENRNSQTPKVQLPCYLLPYARNSGYFGHKAALEACKQVLGSQYTPSSLQAYALYGVGGVGKTSVALECVYALKSTYNVILWFTADTRNKLLQGFTDAAKRLFGSISADPDQDRERVLLWLCQTSERWLLVFDNLDNLDTVKDFWPNSGSGSVLVTSRNPESQFTLTKSGTKIEPFTRPEAKDFLFTMLPGIDPSDATQSGDAEAICTTLAGLALALKQMAAFTRESGCSLGDLSQFLKDKRQQMMLFEDDTGFPKVDYDYTVATAWEISFSRLSAEEMNILGCLCFLDPDAIQKVVTDGLSSACVTNRTLFPGIVNKIKFFQALRMLVRSGLVEKDQKTHDLRVHRLVQDITIHRMKDNIRHQLYEVVLEGVWDGHPKSKKTSDTLNDFWDVCAQFEPHVSNLTNICKEWSLPPQSPERYFDILFESSWYLLERGNMARASELSKLAETYCDLSTKQGKIDMSYLQNTYGAIAFQHERLQEALGWFEKAMDMRKQNLEQFDENIGHAMMNTSLVLIEMGKYEDALNRVNELSDFVEAGGYEDTRLGMGVHYQRAEVLAYLHKLDEAERETVAVEQYFRNDPKWPHESQLAGYLFALRGDINYLQGDLDKASQQHQMSMKIRQGHLGDHIQTAASIYKMGDLSAMKQDFTAAKDLLLESRRMYGSLKLMNDFGEGGKARSCYRLSQVYTEMGDSSSSDIYLQEAMQIRRAIKGSTIASLSLDDVNQACFDALVNTQDLWPSKPSSN